MRERLIVLRERRAGLLSRAAAEREALGAFIDRTDSASRWGEKALSLLAEAKQHPAWIAAGAAFLLAMRPKRALGWAAKGWTLYQLYRRGRVLWERVAPYMADARRAG